LKKMHKKHICISNV